MSTPTKRHRRRYTQSQRRSAVDAVLERLGDFQSVYKACESIGPEVGVGKESLRRWVLAEAEGTDKLSQITPVPLGGNPVDVDRTPSMVFTGADQGRLVLELRDRIKHLEQVNEALKITSAMFAREYSEV